MSQHYEKGLRRLHDFRQYRYCERFQLNEITPDMFKCLHTRLLTKLEQDQKITLQSLAENCQHILNLRADTAKIEERDISNVHTIKNKPKMLEK